MYRGDDVTDAEFEIQINEKGTYRLCVSGKDAKGHVIFSRCREKKDETLFWKYGNNSYYTYDCIAGWVCWILNQ